MLLVSPTASNRMAQPEQLKTKEAKGMKIGIQKQAMMKRLWSRFEMELEKRGFGGVEDLDVDTDWKGVLTEIRKPAAVGAAAGQPKFSALEEGALLKALKSRSEKIQNDDVGIN